MGVEKLSIQSIDRSQTHSVKWESRVSKFGTDDLLPLWVADMDIASPPCVVDALIERAKHPIYGYTIYPDSYYEAIEGWMSRRFGWSIDRDWIVPCYGVVPSINFSIEAYSDIGDGVIVQTPVYPPFFNSVRTHRRKLLENRLLHRDGKYSIDFDDLEIKAKEAKLFILCSPHNPVGRVWDRDELEKIVDICRRYDIKIVSDEIHSDIVYEKVHHILASIAPDITILLNAPSKSFNVAGLNSSFAVISDRKLRSKYSRAQRHSGLGDGNPFGIEATIRAYNSGEDWLEGTKEYFRGNIAYIENFFRESDVDILPTVTEATFLIWLDCTGLGLSDDKLEEFFVKEARLGLNSGISFGSGGSGFMRINIATARETLEEAMSRLAEAYRRVFIDR